MNSCPEKIYRLYTDPIYVHNRIATPDWKIVSHRLGSHNLVYVYGGSGIFDNGAGKKPVKNGDLIYFAPGNFQYMTTDTSTPIRFYTVNFLAAAPQFANNCWSIAPAEFGFPFVSTLEDEAVRRRFILLFERLHHLFPLTDTVRKSRHRETLTELLALAELCTDNKNDKSISYSVRGKINKSVHYMADHYKEHLSLASLAAEVDLSPSYFSAAFREITGKPPIDYLIHFRVFKAKQFLSDGLSVTAAAEAAGFSDIYYFSNVFKRLEGISPKKFKTNLQKEQSQA